MSDELDQKIAQKIAKSNFDLTSSSHSRSRHQCPEDINDLDAGKYRHVP
jgi:hypothetical protein